MATLEELLAQQEELVSLLAAEKQEDTASLGATDRLLADITTKIHALDAEEAAAIAAHATKQQRGLEHSNTLLQQIDERNKDPFADFVDGLNTLVNPAQTRRAWAGEVREIQRDLDMSAAKLEASKARMTQKRITLNSALQEAKLQHSFEVRETEVLETEAARIQGILDARRSADQFAEAKYRALQRPIELEVAKRQLQALREAQALDSIPDLDAVSYEDAAKIGVSARALDEERRNERRAKLALATAEREGAIGDKQLHELAKSEFLDALGPGDLQSLLEQVQGNTSSNVIAVGPFEFTQEELLEQFQRRDKFFLGAASQETGFALAQGQTRANIGVWARLGGGNAPAEMTNLTGLEYLDKTEAVPPEYQPLVSLFTEAHKRFEALPPEQKAAQSSAMQMRAETFAQATAAYVERRLAVLPEDVQPAARAFWATGKIDDPQAASDVLRTYVIDRQKTTDDPIINLMLADLHQRVKSTEIPQTDAVGLSGEERTEIQMRSVLQNDAHVSAIIDQGIHAVSHVTHMELAEKLGLAQLATDLSSKDEKNVLRDNTGAVDLMALHEQLPLYLKEAPKPVSQAEYERAYIALATEKMMASLMPSGDGNLQTASLNLVLFDNHPERVIRHAIVSRLAQLDKMAQMKAAEREALIRNIRVIEERMTRLSSAIATRRHAEGFDEPLMSGLPLLGGLDQFEGLSGAELMSLAGETPEQVDPADIDFTISY